MCVRVIDSKCVQTAFSLFCASSLFLIILLWIIAILISVSVTAVVTFSLYCFTDFLIYTIVAMMQ
jgi:hypothetical protein